MRKDLLSGVSTGFFSTNSPMTRWPQFPANWPFCPRAHRASITLRRRCRTLRSSSLLSRTSQLRPSLHCRIPTSYHPSKSSKTMRLIEYQIRATTPKALVLTSESRTQSTTTDRHSLDSHTTYYRRPSTSIYRIDDIPLYFP